MWMEKRAGKVTTSKWVEPETVDVKKLVSDGDHVAIGLPQEPCCWRTQTGRMIMSTVGYARSHMGRETVYRI